MAELMFPNLAAAFQQGQAFGTNTRLQREGEQRQNQLRDLASRAYAAPAQERQGLIQQAVGVDPEAGLALGGQLEKREADQVARAGNVADYLLTAIDSKNPAQIQGAYNAVKPYFQSIAPAGTAIPDTVDDSIVPMLHQLKAAASGAASGLTNEARTFQQLTQGFTPEELAQARRVNAGLAPRAVTGAAKQLEVAGADGRKRLGTFDPTTQTFLVFDETTNSFRPIGQNETVSEAIPQMPQGPAMAGTGAATTRVDIPGIDPSLQQRVANTAALMAQSGYPQAEIDAFVESQVDRVPQGAPQQATAPAGFGVSRAPEEQAGAITAAQQAAQLDAYRNATGAVAEREAATTAAKSRAELVAALPQTISNADDAIALVDQALAHPGRQLVTGLSGTLDPRVYLPGGPAEDFRTLLNQIQGKNFLQAYNTLRGSGAITDVEGRKAQEAFARLNTAQSDEAFEGALKELRGVIQSGRTKAIQRATSAQSAPAGQYRVGQIIEANGRRYRVTDTSDPSDPDVEEIR